MFQYPIAISLSPNTDKKDVLEAIRILFKPWQWKEGKAQELVKQWFKKYFEIEDIYLFNSGRSALYAILRAYGIGKDDEVIIQAFTCIAAVEPILWVNARPVFVDIEETLNIDPKALEKYITKKTRAIIVQHTFGVPAKINLIKKIAQKHRLFLIEDCAHSLGATINERKVGTFGEAAFFSFGRDKVISSVFGGAAIISSKLKTQNSKLNKFHHNLEHPSYFWILQQLLHPIAFAIILPLYNLVIGKLFLFMLLKFGLLSRPVFKEEKEGKKPAIFPAKYPNALASLLLIQLQKLESYNQSRRQIAVYYFRKLKNTRNIRLPLNLKEAIYLRFNILTEKRDLILIKTKKKGILLGTWYKNLIDPEGIEMKKIGYRKGSCPSAERMALLSVNLPTYPRLKKPNLDLIIEIVKENVN